MRTSNLNSSIPNRPAGARRLDAAQLISRYGIVLVLLVMILVLSVMTPLVRGRQLFLDFNNLILVAQQASINMILALGMTFVITSAGIDLSVGSILAFSGVIAALMMRDIDQVVAGGAIIAGNVGMVVGVLTALLVALALRRSRVRHRVTIPVMLLAGILSGVVFGVLLAPQAQVLYVSLVLARTLGAAAGVLALLLLRKRVTGKPALYALVMGVGIFTGVVLGAALEPLVLRPQVVPFIGFGMALLVGTLCGLFNGFLITRFNLAPFIATLGTLGIFRGLALVISGGLSIFGFGGEYFRIFSSRLSLQVNAETTIGIPIEIFIALGFCVLFWFLLNRTRFGKYTTAIGGNQQTARLAGINVKRYKLGIYALCGFMAGVAGALLLARLRSGDPTYATGDELYAIAAAVIGGTSLMGGEGAVIGTIIGALIISLVRNAMNLWNVPSYWQEVVVGAVIVLAVLLDQWRKRGGQREE